MNKNILKITTIFFLCCFVRVQSQHTTLEGIHLMPWPKEIEKNTNKITISKDFTVSYNKPSERLLKASTKFIRNITNTTGVFVTNGFPIADTKDTTVRITFDTVAELGLQADESYTLSVEDAKVLITAKTDLGAIHALQSVLQLVRFDKNSFYIQGVVIKDEPRFVWRGLMIDVSRHFHPIEVLKRNLDAMSFMKMNVFHWHLSDDQGYRIQSDVFPKLHEAASDGLFYTHSQIKEIVSYANNLGIRVVPEIDVPGHATAILTAYPELGSKEGYTYEIERNSGVFHPTLNPINPKVYDFLDTLFGEIAPLFPDAYFHIGGDENAGKHWDQNKEIQKFMKNEGIENNHELQTYFNIKLQRILSKYGKKLMGWDEIMTKNMPKTAVIHSWRGVNEGFEKGTLIKAVKEGYNAVLSNDYYIDRLQSVNHHYLYDPTGGQSLTSEEKKRVLGGEVTMWSELVTPLTIDSRIWPRTAAIAERFWSPEAVTDIASMRIRLESISMQLEEFGITHLKNRDVILRNITKSADISSLLLLTKIYEPLKIYTRNKGGTEYQTFSPFTLFADACSSDASDAYVFNQLADSYANTPNEETKERLLQYFNSWINGYQNFSDISKNPLISDIAAHYKTLHQLSVLYVQMLSNGSISSKKIAQVQDYLDVLKKPLVDTELVIIPGLEHLINTVK